MHGLHEEAGPRRVGGVAAGDESGLASDPYPAAKRPDGRK